MSKKKLEIWLGQMEPRVPAAFLPFLVQDFAELEEGEAVERETLTTSGISSLGRALGRRGRDRTAAFHLLAADAFITYACESGALEADPRAALGELLTRIGEAFR